MSEGDVTKGHIASIDWAGASSDQAGLKVTTFTRRYLPIECAAGLARPAALQRDDEVSWMVFFRI
jgi:hypothetical protein